MTSDRLAKEDFASNGSNIATGTIADARLASTIARDSEVTAAVAAEATLARNADNLTSGTVAIARLPVDADVATLSLPANTTVSAFGASLIDDAAASNARTTLGLGTAATSNTGDFDAAGAAAAAQAASQPLDTDLTTLGGLTATTDNMIQSVGSAWASRTPTQVKTALSLNNADNTSDANKPVSTATQTALNLKAPLASPTFTGTVTIPDGVGVTDAASFGQVTNLINGRPVKLECRAATTAALPTVVYSNGSSGVGATLTGFAVGALGAMDGTTLAVNDRLLVKNQVAGEQNGAYVVTAVGSGIAVFVLTRATDSDQAADLQNGASYYIVLGTTLTDTTWALSNDPQTAITIGTTALTFAQVDGAGSTAAGNGLSRSGNTLSIDTAVTVDKTTAQTLTNKTLTSPVLNTGVSGTAIDTDSTMAANSDTILASQKATKTALALKANLAAPTFSGTVTSGGDVIGNASLTLNSTTIPTLAADTISALKVVQSSVHVASTSELTFIGTGIQVASTIDLRRVNATYANWTAGSVAAVTSGMNLGGIHIGATTPTLLLDVATFYCVADATFADGSPADSDHASTPTRWEFYTTPASASGRTQTLALTIGSDQSVSGTNKLNLYTVAPATKTAAYDMVDIANATAFTNNAAALTTMGVNLAPVITYSTGVGAGNIGWRGFYDQSTHQSSVASGLAGTFYSFHSSPTIKASGNTNAETMGTLQGFRSDVTLVAGGATGTITVTVLNQFAAPAITVPTNGTVTTLNQINVAGPVATGTITTRRGINITDGSGAGTFTTNIGIDIAALSAGGTNIGIQNAASLLQTGNVGFFGATAAGQRTSGANLTNNVTSGGTDDTITNWTNLSTYSTDAAAIRNAVYQLARKLKQINDGLRTLGLFT